MSHGLNILFFLRTSKTDAATGQAPIYIRLTVGIKRNEISAKRSIEPARWDGGSGKAKGTKEDVRTLNAYLDSLRQKLNRQFNQLLNGDEPVTAELLKKYLPRKNGSHQNAAGAADLLQCPG